MDDLDSLIESRRPTITNGPDIDSAIESRRAALLGLGGKPRTGADPVPQAPTVRTPPLGILNAPAELASGVQEQLGDYASAVGRKVYDPNVEPLTSQVARMGVLRPGMGSGAEAVGRDLGSTPSPQPEPSPQLPPSGLPPGSHTLGDNVTEGYQQLSQHAVLGTLAKGARFLGAMADAPDTLTDRGAPGTYWAVEPGRQLREFAGTVTNAIGEPQTAGGKVGALVGGMGSTFAAGAVGGPAGVTAEILASTFGAEYTSTLEQLRNAGIPEPQAKADALKLATLSAPAQAAIFSGPQGRLIEGALSGRVAGSFTGELAHNFVAGAAADAVHQVGQMGVGTQAGYSPAETLTAGGENALAAGIVGGAGRVLHGGMAVGNRVLESKRAKSNGTAAPLAGQQPVAPQPTSESSGGTTPPEAVKPLQETPTPTTPPPQPVAPVKPIEPPKTDTTGGDFPPRPAMTKPAVEGRGSVLRLADGNDRPMRYDVIEARDLVTTHKPEEGFAVDPAGDFNERPYQDPTEGKASRDRVNEIAMGMKPDLILTNSPTATDGPPITTEDYRVLGGNARAMGIKLAYARGTESAQAYRSALASQAETFGIDRSRLDGMEHPILVRRIEGAVGKRGELSRILNESLTTGKTADTDSVSRGLLLKQDHTDSIAQLIGDRTLREVLANPKDATRIIQQFVEAGALSPSDLVKYREADGTLNDAGKDAIENTLLGAAIGDVRALAQTSAGLRGKIIRGLPSITRLRRSEHREVLDFQQTLAHALDALHDLGQSGYKSFRDLVDQQSMIRESWRDDPRAIALASSLLEDSPTRFAGKLRDVAAIAEQTRGGQGGFDFGQPQTLADAFDQVFSSAVSSASPIGLFGQETPGAKPKQLELPMELPARKDDWRARRPGETDQEYRIRLRWGSPDQIKQTPALFGEESQATSSESPSRRRPMEINRSELPKFDSVGELRDHVRAAVSKEFEAVGSVYSDALGADVLLSKKGLRHALQMNRTMDALWSLLRTPEIIESGKLAKSEEPAAGSPAALRKVHHIEAEVKIRGKEYTATAIVKEYARGDGTSMELESIHTFYHQKLKNEEGPPPGFESKGPGPFARGPSAETTEARPDTEVNGPATESASPRKAQEGKKPVSGPPRPTQGRGRTVYPNERSNVQTPENRPEGVREDIRRMRERMQEDVRTEATDRAGGTGRYDKDIDVREQAEKERRELMRPRSPRSIISDLYESLHLGGPTTPVERSKRGSALGRYFWMRQDIKNERADAVRTAIHEAGHYLHELLFPKVIANIKSGRKQYGNTFPKEWMPELEKLGKDLYGSRKPGVGYAGEGWAEFAQQIVLSPEGLKRKAPTVYREVTRMLVTEHPDVWNALLRARVAMKFNEQAGTDAANNIRQYVRDFEAKLPVGVREHLAEFKSVFLGLRDRVTDFRVEAIDRTQRAADFNKDLNLSMAAHRDPHIMALRVGGKIRGEMRNLVERGPWNPRDPMRKPIMPGLAEILRPVKDQLDEWQYYMVAKRVKEKREQGFGGLFSRLTEQEVQNIIEAGDANPAFAKAAEQFQSFNEWLIRDYAVAHDLITPELAEKIIDKNLHYITFQVVDPDGGVSNATRKGGRKFASNTSGIRRFNPGRGEEILPPLGPFMQSMQGIVARANMNKVARAFTDHFNALTFGAGRWLAQADVPLEQVKLRNSTFQDAVTQFIDRQVEQGVLTLDEAQSKELAEALSNLQSPKDYFDAFKHDKRTRTISVMVGGKHQFYKVLDKRLYDLMDGMTNPESATGLIKFLTIPASILRKGATTLNPEFFVYNMDRDLGHALTMSDAQFRDAGSLAGRLRGMKAAWTGGDVVRLWNAYGGDMGTLGYTDKQGRLNPRELFAPRSVWQAYKDFGVKGAALDLLELGPIARINEHIERMTRFGEMEAIRGDLMDEASIAKAVQAGADITLDFSRGGRLAKNISQFDPFFNAAIQGGDKLARFIRQNPLKAFVRTFTFIIAPSIVTMVMNQNNEDYWNKGLQLRDQYWWIPLGHDDLGRMRYFRMPKPQGLGLFGILAERSYARVLGRDPLTGKPGGDPRAFRKLGASAASQMLPPVGVQAIQPLVEAFAGPQGWSYYFDRPIVPNQDRERSKPEQGATTATGLARAIGRLTDSSPAIVDHLIYGYGGGLGNVMARGVSHLIPDDGLQGKPMPIRFGDYVLIRKFLAASTRGDHEALRRFFDDFDELKAVHNDLKARETDAAQQAFLEKHKQAIELYPAYEQTYQHLLKVWKAKRAALKEPNLTGDDLDKKLTELDAEAIAQIRALYQARKEQADKSP